MTRQNGTYLLRFLRLKGKGRAWREVLSSPFNPKRIDLVHDLHDESFDLIWIMATRPKPCI